MKNRYWKLRNLELHLIVDLYADLENFDELDLLFSDVEFLEAIITRLKVDLLLDKCKKITTITPKNHKLIQTLAQVQQLSYLESHHFRKIDSSLHPSLILQQIYNRAKELNLSSIVTAASKQLRRRRGPYLSLNWNTREAMTPLQQTLTTEGVLYSISVTNDNQYLVGEGDSFFQVWDLSSGQHQWSNYGVKKAVAVRGEAQVITVSESGKLTLWDLVERIAIWSSSGCTGVITDILVITKDQKIVSVSFDGSILIWDLKNGQLLQAIKGQARTHKLTLIPGKNWFATTSSGEETIKLWNYDTGQQELDLVGHRKGVISLAITTDGKRIGTISYDNTVRVWNVETGAEESVFAWNYCSDIDDDFEGASLSTTKVVFSQEFIVFSLDIWGTLEVWDYQKRVKISTLASWVGVMTSAKVFPDGKHIAVTYSNGGLRVFELQSGEIISEWMEHDASSICLSMALDGEKLFSGSSNSLKIWDAKKLLEDHTVSHRHDSRVQKIISVPIGDSVKIVSVSAGGEIKIYDLETGRENSPLNQEPLKRDRFVKDLVVSRNGEHLTLVTDERVNVWNLLTKENEGSLYIERGFAIYTDIAIEANLATVISHKTETDIQVYDLITGDNLQQLIGTKAPLDKVSISPNGCWVISQSVDTLLEVWSLTDEEKQKELRLYAHYNMKIMATTEERRIVTLDNSATHGSSSRLIRIWDLDAESGHPLYELEVESWRVSLTADRKGVLALTHSGELTIWDIRTGRVVKTLMLENRFGAEITVISQNQVIITYGQPGDIEIWNIKTGKKEKTLGRHQPLIAIVNSLDGQTVASIGGNRELKIWNIETGASTLIFDNFIGNLSIILDEKRIIYFHDKTIHIWNIDQQCEEAALSGHKSEIMDISVVSFNHCLISVSDREIIVWDMKTYEIKQEIVMRDKNKIESVDISADGQYVVISRSGTNIKIWDRLEEKVKFDLVAQAGYRDVLSFTPNSEKVLLSCIDGTCRIRDLESEDEEIIRSTSLFFLTPVASHAFFRYEDDAVVDWNLASGRQEKTLIAPTDRVLALTHDGKTAICKHDRNVINLWDLEQGKNICSAIIDGDIECASTTPNETTIIIGDGAGHIHCMELLKPEDLI